MTHLLLVSLGGAIGAGFRYLAGVAAFRYFGPNFPWGTMIINVLGSLAMGLLIGFLAKRSGTPNEVRIFLATGILGGFTTFSAFSLDAINLWERGELAMAAGYIVGSVLLSLFALFAGLLVVRSIA
ncbi:MAG: fluoride efflux transporter CrcB [Rhizobiaceae bacterium]|nr:fluoride efflux transporter CrcB [Rhizobiaceae bacterium]